MKEGKKNMKKLLLGLLAVSTLCLASCAIAVERKGKSGQSTSYSNQDEPPRITTLIYCDLGDASLGEHHCPSCLDWYKIGELDEDKDLGKIGYITHMEVGLTEFSNYHMHYIVEWHGAWN